MIEEVDKCGELFDEAIAKAIASKPHPLLNNNSKHYQMFDGMEAIEILESIMTTEELMAWCRGNVYKYRLRIANKDSVESDAKKIKTYEDYYMYLKEMV